jgi:GNAT superfamily N-acetyltransferase
MSISLFSKAWQLLRQEGPAAAWRALWRRIYYRHGSIWFERILDDRVQLIPPRFNGRMDFEHPERVLTWIKERNVLGTNDPVEIAHMQERGHLFAGILDGDELIGHVKIGWGRIYVLDFGTELDFSPEDCVIIDIYVAPEKRGLGAGPFLISAVSLEMKRRGFRRRIMHVRSNNEPMLRATARAGDREIGRVDFRSILGRKQFHPHPMMFLGTAGEQR